jgi:acetyl/propionyl-CoA carboxylase alpha subunit
MKIENKQKKLLIANRGEIACRILRAAKERGYCAAVIATNDDMNSLVCQKADHVIPVSSFLNAKEIVKKAQEWQADLIHPGYGFLSENADFAKLIEQTKITFVGPTSENMISMGAKESAKKIAQECHVSTLNALFSKDLENISCEQWKNELEKKGISAPYLVKASGGGGGRGMRVVERFEDLENAVARASEEAQSSFGNSTVFVERYLIKPRHIEIQVFGDGCGGGIFFGERECSLQRRHQKVIEESPSSFVSKSLRQKMGKASLDLVKKTKYQGAGTVEFLVDENENFYFLEMNTRLQVEHPVTELSYGIDLVHAQFDLASGFWPKTFPDPNTFCLLEPSGVSLEARILAEDPKNHFLPTPGKICFYQEPQGEGIRVDSGVIAGSVINSNFDSMIAKLIVHSETRAQAVEKLKKALSEFIILGCTTNISFLKSIASHPDFLCGKESTSWISENLDELNKSTLDASMIDFFSSKKFSEKLAFVMLGKGILQGVNRTFASSDEDFFEILPEKEDHKFLLKNNKINLIFYAIRVSKQIHISVSGEFLMLPHPMYESYEGSKRNVEKAEVHAPMAGKVFEILIKQDDSVEPNQVLFILESMKMQLEIRSSLSGKVKKICVEKGQILKGPDLMAVLQ